MIRFLGALLLIQVALGLGLLVWAVQGFPLPGFLADEEPAAAAPSPRAVDRFDARRALALVREQVALGPRPAGSAASRRLARRMRARLPAGRLERARDARAKPGQAGGAGPGGLLLNVVGSLPGRRPAVVLGAHYDTFARPGFVGANDGASGVAVVVEVARALRRMRRGRDAPEVRFVLFDGEEAPPGADDFLTEGVRGSRAYARRHARELGAVVVVDMVGDRALAIPREAGSDPRLWARLRTAAARVGVARAFPPRTVGEILDDHTPFARRGVPAIDVIDFTFPAWHTRADDLDAVSARSLDAVGEAVVELLRGR
jgi:glutaminyl-peptide cyclotransferase